MALTGFGGGGGATTRAEPKKICTPYGGDVNPAAARYLGNNEYTPITTSISPILRINDSPVGGTLSGAYQFTYQYNVLNSTQQGVTAINISLTNTFDLTTLSTAVSFSGTYFAGQELELLISPTGTTPIPQEGIFAVMSVTGLTAGGVWPTYTGLFLPIFNADTITSGEAWNPFVEQNPAPGYPIELLRGSQKTHFLQAIPKGTTTFNVNMTIRADTGAGVYINRADASAIGFISFDTGNIATTVESSL